jgi:hypothetical protein
MATNFDAVLEQLSTHEGSVTIMDSDETIEITSQREFKAPSNYNFTLGYVGDVNSQIVTFKFPLAHEGHSLEKCAKKKLNWKNKKSGAEGSSNLIVLDSSENGWRAKWEVPPEAMTMAGIVEIGVSISDVVVDNNKEKVVFSWNTPSFNKFMVEESFNQTADVYDPNNVALPARNEILVVDVDNRSIVAPSGWSPTVCCYGDIGVSKLFFEVNRYVRGMDLLNAWSEGSQGTEISIGAAFLTDTAQDFKTSSVRSIYETIESKKSNKVLVSWDIPSAISNNEQKYIGDFVIYFKVEEKDVEAKVVKRWTTQAFSNLKIGTSLLMNDLSDFVSREEELVRDIIKEEMFDSVFEQIDDYMDTTYFITDDN